MNKNYTDQLARIREHGYRVTPQRLLILEALAQHNGHATAVEVYDFIAKQAPTVNKATIYRVLEFFCEVQLATKTEMGGRIYYEIADEVPHHHLICTACESVIRFANHHFDDLVTHLAEEHGFKADINHLAIPGVCESCQQN